MRPLASATVLLLVLLLAGCANGITVMSYNVENLFDDVHDGSEYPAFDPARGTWTTDLFYARIDAIAEVIRKSVSGGPDIVLLQEVENGNALDTLADRGLRGMGYGWRVFVPKPKVSANVAILSRLPVARVHSFAVGPWERSTPVRDVIEAEITVSGRTLHVFDNHWKAKTDGVRATESSRRESAAALAGRIREILSIDPDAEILAAGDFNENVDEYERAGERYVTALVPDSARLPAAEEASSIALSGDALRLGARGARLELYDPWLEVRGTLRGSYAYQGDWLTVDHMLLSPGLLDAMGLTYRRGSFMPVRLSFLLRPDGIPRSAADPRGPRGYSDHLPVILALDVRN
jgi:endonuclease/exonuclease/phosphatase family metal-dependent hydrolase